MLRKHYPDIQRLDFYADVSCGPFGTAIKLSDYRQTGVPLLRIANIAKQGTIDTIDLVFLSEEKAKALARYQVKPGDLVISQRGTLGMPAIVPDDYPVWIVSANLIAIRVRNDISPLFIQQFLSSGLGRTQLERRQSGQVQGKITTEDVASVLIPKVMNEHMLVQQLEAARAERQRKLDEAESLLAGIDDLVLEQLGIALPEARQEHVYAVRLDHVNPQRLDTYFYNPHLLQSEMIIRRFQPEVVPLCSLLSRPPVNGIDAREYVSNGRIYLRVQNIRPFEIVLDDAKQVSITTKKDIAIKAGDVLLTRKGTFGVAVQVPQGLEGGLISSEVILLRVKDNAKVSAEFLIAWLNCSAAQRLFDRYKSGGIMGHITQDVVCNFPVPVPNSETQALIVKRIREIRRRAKHLEQQAELEWQAAKARFEKALLGEP